MGIKLRAALLFLIFLTGFLSMALELVIIRQLSFYVGSSAVITSIIIAAFLGFMSLGYFRGAAIKPTRFNARKVLCVSFIVIALTAALAASFTMVAMYFHLMYLGRITSGIIQTFIYSIIFLSVAPFLFGFNVALLSRYLHKHDTNYTGNIMAWDTIGSVLGSLAATLILMPFIGVNYTILLIIILALAAAAVVMPRWKVFVAGVIILVPALIINSDRFLERNFDIIANNAKSTILIKEFGDNKVLVMNGIGMSIYNKNSRTFDEYINHVNKNFIYNMPRDKQREILILGAGGFTAGLDDTFNNYTFVDIEKTLKKISEQKFLGEKLTPNKKFVVQDASQFLKNTAQKYDLIFLDVYSNSYQVPEGLITAEFMQRIKARVADNGIVVMNIVGSPSFDDKYTRVFDNTFHSVFTHNTQRQTVGDHNPWTNLDSIGVNLIYIWYNRPKTDRVYTINKTPVVYDRK